MTNSGRPSRFLWAGMALLALAGCETREIAEPPLTPVVYDPAPDRGGVWIAFALTGATLDLSRPIYTHYRVFMDGSQMAWPNTDGHGTSQPVVLGEGGSVSAGYVPAGRHHFAIAEAGGGATIFAGDGDIPAGSLTRLYLFGPSGALQGRFVSHRELPPPGMLHVSAMNLMRDGRRIEVVSCADPTDCVSLSPPLALGESFDADFAAAPLEMPDASVPDDRLAGGAGLSYRAVPTDALPVPWLQPLIRGITLHPSIGTPANLVAAPNHMDADGRVLSFQI